MNFSADPYYCFLLQVNFHSHFLSFQARLWIQIMKQLRHGVKLKKVEHCTHSLEGEYELTPYEMLMKDIVFKRYTLNKIMVCDAWPS